MSNTREQHDFDRCKWCTHFRADFVIGSDGFNHLLYRCKKKAFSGHEKDCPHFERMGGGK